MATDLQSAPESGPNQMPRRKAGGSPGNPGFNPANGVIRKEGGMPGVGGLGRGGIKRTGTKDTNGVAG